MPKPPFHHPREPRASRRVLGSCIARHRHRARKRRGRLPPHRAAPGSQSSPTPRGAGHGSCPRSPPSGGSARSSVGGRSASPGSIPGPPQPLQRPVSRAHGWPKRATRTDDCGSRMPPPSSSQRTEPGSPRGQHCRAAIQGIESRVSCAARSGDGVIAKTHQGAQRADDARIRRRMPADRHRQAAKGLSRRLAIGRIRWTGLRANAF